MTTTQVSSLLAMMDTDQVEVNYNIGMATNGIPTTLSTNPTFATISMERFYVMKTSADTPATAELHKETKKVTGALYQPVAGTPNYSFIEFGQDICHFWAFVSGQALIVPEPLSTVELRAEVLKRELENFSTAISCDAQGNVEIGRNLKVDGDGDYSGNLTVEGVFKQDTYEFDKDLEAVVDSAAISAGFSIYYQHARKSNGKLNIVFALKATKPITFSGTVANYNFTIDNSIGSKLHPAVGGVLDNSVKSAIQINNDGAIVNTTPSNQYVACDISKNSDTNLALYCYAKVTADPSYNYIWRFEFNFILS